MKIKGFKLNRSALIHVIVWTIIFLLPYIFTPPDAQHDPVQKNIHFFITSMTVVWMSLFYLNAGILIPRFLYAKKYLLYLLILLILYCAAVLVYFPLFSVFIPQNPHSLSSALLLNILPFLFIVMVSATYKTIYDRIKSEAIFNEKQKENLKTELSFLRSQISPHFLFNVLNNIVSLVRLKSDELEPTVLKLSSLMQYMLYETDEEKVLLADEVQYLQSYIDLQQQRFGARVKIETALNADNSMHLIEPMLLIPFVENAFKHGVGLIKEPVIKIMLDVKENMLHFFVKNKYNIVSDSKDKTSGIGLANVKRRLTLLYKKDYTLDINNDNNVYTISLQLKLNP